MRKRKPQPYAIVKKLRLKFVIITMILMTLTLGIPYLYDYIEAVYWEESSTVYILKDCINDPEYFDSDKAALEEYFGATMYIVSLDNKKNILSIDATSDDKVASNPSSEIKNTISSLSRNGSANYKWKNYAYVLRQYDDGYKLAFIDTSEGKTGVFRRIVDAVQISLVLLAILLISLMLSRFVTKPAQIAFNREKQFVSDASHELKTPLSAISINAHALLPELGDNKHLQNIISESKRMDELIKNLLRLSYMDEAGATIEKYSFDLSKCSNEIALSMEGIIYEKAISFNYDIAEDVAFTGNAPSIKQLIAILLDNAMQHTPAEGEIKFTLSTHGRCIYITVSNSGPGIPPEDLPHIFERFYRIDKSRQKSSLPPDAASEENHNNYGLGLAIAKSIVEAHNGTISAHSEYGKGATLTAELPMTRPDKEKRK